MSEPRFLVPPGELTGGPGETASVRGSELHHLARVLRLQPGDQVSLFDGGGQGFTGRLESITREEARVRLTARDARAVEPSFRLTLAQGIPRQDRMEVVVQKTTEIGIARIVPIVAGRSVARPGRRGAWPKLERWRKVAREAARQSGRLCVPEVAAPVTWGEFVAACAAGPAVPRLLFEAEEGAPAAAEGIDLDVHVRSAVVAVGPEGGWAPEELALALGQGFRQVLIGPRILRTETAGIVATALLLFLAGEMGRPGRFQIPP